MKKFCFILSLDDEICPPLFFETYSEAYEAMKTELRTQMEENCPNDGWVGEDEYMKALQRKEDPGMYNISEDAMWWRCGDNCGDGAIFEIDVSTKEWRADLPQDAYKVRDAASDF